MILSVLMACALAAPITYSGTHAHSRPTFIGGPLRHINQLNDDGSYTFGYESADGSYRMETRDINGFVQGRYGFVDPNGELHEVEYVAGAVSGHSIGYQARNAQLHSTSEWPVIRTAPKSTVQIAQDFEYSSVDANQDGIPDNLGSTRLTSVVAPQTASQVVEVAPTINTNTVRVVETAQTPIQAPVSVESSTADNVRLTVQQPIPVTSDLQLTSAVLPLRQQQPIHFQQQSVIRTQPTTFVVQEQQQPIQYQQQSVIRTQPTTVVVQEQQPTLISTGGQFDSFFQKIQQPTTTNVIRNVNTKGGQGHRGGVRFTNTLLGNAAY